MSTRTRSRNLATNSSSPVVEFRNPSQEADDRLANNDSDSGKADDFPTASLPTVIRDFVTAVSAKFQTPHALAAVNALGVISGSLGTGLRVRTFSGDHTTANLYLVAVAKTGTGKSRVSKAVIAPFERIEEEAREKWKQNTKAAVETQMAVASERAGYLRRKAARETDETEKASRERELIRLEQDIESSRQLLISPRYMCQDSTEQKLAVLTMQNGGTMFLYDGEARNIFSNIEGRYDKEGQTSEGVLLKGFSGDSLRVDRIGRDPVWVKEPCITVCVCVQPDKFQKLLSSDVMHDNGFIYRLLFCDTFAEPQFLNGDVDCSIPNNIQTAWDTLIDKLVRTWHRHSGEPLEVQCMPAALKLFCQFHNEHLLKGRNGTSQLTEGYAVRSMEKAFRVALCLHAAEHSDSPYVCGLSEQTAQNAIDIVSWFDKQAISFLHERTQTQFEKEMKKVLEIAAKPKFSDGFTANNVHQYTKWEAQKCAGVLGELITVGKLSKRETRGENGKPMTVYSLPTASPRRSKV